MNFRLSLIALAFSLFSFSCSEDDDSSRGLQEGWTDERIDEAVKECQESTGLGIPKDKCRCSVEATAKVVSFNDFDSNEEYTSEQLKAIGQSILDNCGIKVDDFFDTPVDTPDSGSFQAGWTTENINAAVAACELSPESTGIDCRCSIEETAKIVPFASLGSPTQEQSMTLAQALAKCTSGL